MISFVWIGLHRDYNVSTLVSLLHKMEVRAAYFADWENGCVIGANFNMFGVLVGKGVSGAVFA